LTNERVLDDGIATTFTSGGSNAQIDVNFDDVTIGVNGANALYVKNNAIGTNQIIDNSITVDDIGPGAVGTSEIIDNSITVNDIGTGAVGSDEIIDNSITVNDIGTGAVGSDEIIDNSITVDDIGTGAVGSDEIINGSIAPADLGPGTYAIDISGNAATADVADKVQNPLTAGAAIGYTAAVGTTFDGSAARTIDVQYDNSTVKVNGSNQLYVPYIKGRIATTGGVTQTILDANITATSTVILIYEDPAGGSVISIALGARVAGTSFTVMFAAAPPAGSYINYMIIN
jgi:hypothetical protein